MNQQQPQMQVDFSQTTAEICEECKHDIFIPAFKMRKLSALLSPAGKETMIPMNVFACAKCGHINKAFLPNNIDDDTV
tara:strand:+ start:148 stop:381 length:234 start_codon:yes stop_codon:yes gene_type:complete